MSIQDVQDPQEHILQFFGYEHLPPDLQLQRRELLPVLDPGVEINY